MDLHRLPPGTPTTVSSCSTDPLYDNCPPFAAQRQRDMESQAVCPAVTRPLDPCSSPLTALTPAVVHGPAWSHGGRAPGAWPDHSYCSWEGGLGRAGWGAQFGPGKGTGSGGGGGAQGGEDRDHLDQSPKPSQSDQHRSALSLYDNLPEAVTPEDIEIETSFLEHMYQTRGLERIQGLTEDDGPMEDKSSWSSCEIILADHFSSSRDHNPDQEAKEEQDEAVMNLGFELPLPVSPQNPTSGSPQLCPAESLGLWVQHQQQPSWSPRLPPPVPQADPSARALRSILTNLQQQIVQQREQYEERIQSLERRNEELQVEVVRLKTNLLQQRQWYQVVQSKIAESERARAAAEQRNATLQRELEQFFDTFGELNNEAKKTEYIVKSF